MKSIFCVGIAVAVFFFACEKKQVATIQPSVSATLQTRDYSYIVSAFKRNVSWSMSGETWQPVTVGLGIAKGGFVETGEVSAATLSGTLGDIVMLGEKAKIELLAEKLLKQTDGSSLAQRGVSILNGTARFTIAKGIGTFMVQTPSARVKVKGTDFLVTYNEKSKATDVRVLEGAVDIDDKKQASKTYVLSKGQALLGVGTATPVQRSMSQQDSAFFMDAVFADQGREEQMQRVSEETPEEVRSRLSATANAITGKEITVEQLKSEARIENERAASQGKIDSVRTDYQAKAQAEKDTFANRKAEAQTAIDDTKSTAQSALDAQRAKFKAATGLQKSQFGGKSQDAFDELKKRKTAAK